MNSTATKNFGYGFLGQYLYVENDPRTDDWFMMSSIWPTFYMIGGYLAIVLVIGPWWMKNRQPFQLRKVLIVYSGLQTAFSAWLFYEFGMGGWFQLENIPCQPLDRSTNPTAMRLAGAVWWYYISKFTEFFDTFLFILRKKSEHVSALHVYHHAVMPLTWASVKLIPGGPYTLVGFFNSFVHILMYLYYMISAMGPQYKKFLWWKKYITVIQISQFVTSLVYATYLFCGWCDSGVPQSVVALSGLYGFFFLFLFTDFYKSSYSSEKPGAVTPKVCNKQESEVPKRKGLNNKMSATVALVVAMLLVYISVDVSLNSKLQDNLAGRRSAHSQEMINSSG